MSGKDDGGHAFPTTGGYNTAGGTFVQTHENGMSLRMYIAVQAMQGELAAQTDEAPWTELDKLAARSFRIADAMIAESKK